MSTILHTGSTFLQFMAAYLSSRLVKIAGRWDAWCLINVALTITGLTSAATLFRLLMGEISTPLTVRADLTILCITALLAAVEAYRISNSDVPMEIGDRTLITGADDIHIHAVITTVEKDVEGRAMRCAIVSQDVTVAKQAEQALRQSDERFRAHFELGLIGMAISLPDKGLEQFNDAICNILGYTREGFPTL